MGGRPIGILQQNAPVAGLSAAAAAAKSAGYCSGVAIDWIRRVLIPKIKNGESIFKATYGPGKELRHAERHADAWSNLSPAKQREYLVAATAAFQNRANAAEAELGTRLSDAQDLLEGQLAKIRVIDKPDDIKAQLRTRVHADYQSKKVELEELLTQLEARMSSWGESPAIKKLWLEYARAMDGYLKTERTGRGKKTGPARGFERLMVIKFEEIRFYNDVEDFLDLFIGDNEFTTNRAVFSTFSPPGSTGHTVAFKHQNTGTYLFMDPNFGIFEYALADELKRAVAWLLVSAYPVFGDRSFVGQIRGTYTIFQGKEAPVPSVTQAGLTR